MRNLYTKVGPIRLPEDLSQIKLRVPPSPINIELWQTLGVGSVGDLGRILVSSGITSAAILILAGVGVAFSYIVAIQHAPQIILAALLSVTTNEHVIVAMIVAVLIVAGMFVGRTANVLLFGPIIVPIFLQFGYTPVHTGIVIIMVLGVGHLTPPVGGTLLTVCLVGRCSMAEILRYIWPHIIAEIVLTIAIIMLPEISNALPRFLGLRGV